MAVGKSKYLVTLYLYKLTQPSDPLILGGPLILPGRGSIPPPAFPVPTVLRSQLNNEKPTTEGRTVRTPNGKQQIGRIGGHGFYIDSTSVKSTFFV